MHLLAKEKAKALLKSLENRDRDPVRHINPNQDIQYNLMVEGGLASIKNLVEEFPINTQVYVVRFYLDEAFVFAHIQFDFSGPKIGFDVFRVFDDLIIADSNSLKEPDPLNSSGHSMINDATLITGPHKTDGHKESKTNKVADIVVNIGGKKLPGYLAGGHSKKRYARFPDEILGLVEALSDWASQGVVMKYTTIHKLLVEGNPELMITEGNLTDVYATFFELLRIENSKWNKCKTNETDY